MAHCILRVKKLKTWGSIAASCAHTFREVPTPNADPTRTPKNQVLGAKSSKAVMASVRSRVPAKRRKDAVLALEYLVTASPEFFAGDRGRIAYFSAALNWLKAAHGPANMVSASIHLDEKTPHLVVYVVPLTADGRLAAKNFVGGPQKLSRMQTDFHQLVGDKFGLVRGVMGSKATHKAVQRFYSGLSTPPKLPEIGALDHLVAAVGIKTSAMKDRLQAEVMLRHRASAASVQTLSDLRSGQNRAKVEASAEKAEREKQSVAAIELVGMLQREVDIQRAEVIRLRELVTQQGRERDADGQRFAALQAQTPQGQVMHAMKIQGSHLRPSSQQRLAR